MCSRPNWLAYKDARGTTPYEETWFDPASQWSSHPAIALLPCCEFTTKSNPALNYCSRLDLSNAAANTAQPSSLLEMTGLAILNRQQVHQVGDK
jgi:hypothetical protein